MDRKTKRDSQRLLNNLKAKAIKDTENWILTLQSPPTKNEVLAFQAGYISGTRRASQQ